MLYLRVFRLDLLIFVRTKAEITLPKAQHTQGLSSGYQSTFFRSYHKFLNKFWSNFIFIILTKQQLQNLNQISAFRLNLNFKILTKHSFRISVAHITCRNLWYQKYQNSEFVFLGHPSVHVGKFPQKGLIGKGFDQENYVFCLKKNWIWRESHPPPQSFLFTPKTRPFDTHLRKMGGAGVWSLY